MGRKPEINRPFSHFLTKHVGVRKNTDGMLILLTLSLSLGNHNAYTFTHQSSQFAGHAQAVHMPIHGNMRTTCDALTPFHKGWSKKHKNEFL